MESGYHRLPAFSKLRPYRGEKMYDAREKRCYKKKVIRWSLIRGKLYIIEIQRRESEPSELLITVRNTVSSMLALLH